MQDGSDPQILNSVISVRDLVVGFSDHLVLNHLSLDVRRGEILGLVGASGGGKSVLLRTIIGLSRNKRARSRCSGSTRDSASPETMRGIERRWGMLFQQGALFSSLSVRQNVEFPMREYLHLSAELAAGGGAHQSSAWWASAPKTPKNFPRSFPAE